MYKRRSFCLITGKNNNNFYHFETYEEAIAYAMICEIENPNIQIVDMRDEEKYTKPKREKVGTKYVIEDNSQKLKATRAEHVIGNNVKQWEDEIEVQIGITSDLVKKIIGNTIATKGPRGQNGLQYVLGEEQIADRKNILKDILDNSLWNQIADPEIKTENQIFETRDGRVKLVTLEGVIKEISFKKVLEVDLRRNMEEADSKEVMEIINNTTNLEAPDNQNGLEDVLTMAGIGEEERREFAQRLVNSRWHEVIDYDISEEYKKFKSGDITIIVRDGLIKEIAIERQREEIEGNLEVQENLSKAGNLGNLVGEETKPIITREIIEEKKRILSEKKDAIKKADGEIIEDINQRRAELKKEQNALEEELSKLEPVEISIWNRFSGFLAKVRELFSGKPNEKEAQKKARIEGIKARIEKIEEEKNSLYRYDGAFSQRIGNNYQAAIEANELEAEIKEEERILAEQEDKKIASTLHVEAMQENGAISGESVTEGNQHDIIE